MCYIFALHISSIGYFAKEQDPVILSIIQMFVAGILSIIFVIIFEPGVKGVSMESIFPILYLSILSTLIAFFDPKYSTKIYFIYTCCYNIEFRSFIWWHYVFNIFERTFYIEVFNRLYGHICVHYNHRNQVGFF